MTGTPARELREAAKLMRERATAIGGPPSWAADRMDQVHAVYRDEAGAERSRLLLARCSLNSMADYTAAMRPPVTYAVADWLDEAADDAERLAGADELMSGFQRRSMAEEALGRSVEHALTVARAYLNTGDGS